VSIVFSTVQCSTNLLLISIIYRYSLYFGSQILCCIDIGKYDIDPSLINHLWNKHQLNIHCDVFKGKMKSC